MANQFSNRPSFCDFLERYQAHYKPKWSKSQLVTIRVGIGRFDEWLKICDHKLHELTWQKLLEFHRFLALQGTSGFACKRAVENAKHALKWGISTGELPQKIEDIYTFHIIRHEWDIELPKLSQAFLSELEPTRPGAFRAHRYAHRVFHSYLSEKKLTYKRLKTSDLVLFVKFLKNKGFHQRSMTVLPIQVRCYLYWLYRNKKIKRHPEDIFPRRLVGKKLASLPRPIDPIVDQKIQHILENTDDLYYKAILLLRRTGLRISELRKLQFECIQIDQKNRASLIVPIVKLGIERRVPLDTKTIELIKSLQEMSRKNYKRKINPKALVVGPNGIEPRYERYATALTEICARLGVKKWINLHSLRHTYATVMLNSGLSITSLKEILGHKTINMSLSYAKVSQEKIHLEYSQILQNMSEKQVPHILNHSAATPADAFVELGNTISKSIDDCRDSKKIKQLRALKNRLAKCKMELLKLQE